MDRRNFLQIAAVTTLVGQGHLPLLAAERKRPRKARVVKKDVYTAASNIYTEPSAIEPITGYLDKFKRATGGTMSEAFKAKYSLVECHGSRGKSNNRILGSLDIAVSDGVCKTREVRKGRPQNVVTAEINFGGKLNSVSSWRLQSIIEGDLSGGFVEKGTCDGKVMVVKSKSWEQKHKTGNPLIARWSLPGLIASGRFKSGVLRFDMLDDSTLRPEQVISYAGTIEVPVAGGTAKLDSYVQTGWGIVPTHYLVDADGRVQLITMSRVNWALNEVSGK